jgi:hypothetical protein
MKKLARSLSSAVLLFRGRGPPKRVPPFQHLCCTRLRAARGLSRPFCAAMRRALALPALALACLASRAAALGASPSAVLPRPEEVYAPLLAGASRHAVGGYVTADGFAPLKPSEARPARPQRPRNRRSQP